MKSIVLTKELRLPDGTEGGTVAILDRHERWLRLLIANGFTPIYLGDRVRVSDRWAAPGSENPHKGKTGIVDDIDLGLQAAFNIEYMIYRIKPRDGKPFETWHYTLDREYQPQGNKLLEKLLRETNPAFEAAIAHKKP